MNIDITLEQLDTIQIHFIVAGPRTGSTLLSTMLNHHSQILSPSEEPFAYTLYFKYHTVKNWDSRLISQYVYDFYLFSDWKLLLQFCNKEEFAAALEKYKNALNFERVIKLTYMCFHPQKDKSKITHIVDKQLKTKNYWVQMAQFYPESKFILLFRDPMDTVPRVKELRSKKLEPNTTFMKEAIRFNDHYNALLNAQKKIEDKRVFVLKYEDLILNAQQSLEYICNFIGLSYEASMLAYDEKMKKNLSTIKMEDLNEDQKKGVAHSINIHEGLTKQPDSDKIGEWKSTISPDEANRIWYYCRETAIKMGYEKDKQITLPESKKRFHYSISFLSFLRYNLVIKLWYKLPFTCWYWIKKIKYNKHIQKKTFFK